MPAIPVLLSLVAVLAATSAAAAPQYVAMGSSYAAGPGITPVVPGSPPRCARSTRDYAHVLAELRHLSLVDVTCSGATTVDVLRGGQFDLPPQLDAVTAETQVITVTIGGNDVFFMGNLIAMSCGMPGGCKVRPDEQVEARFATLPDSLRQIVTVARQRNPKIRVVFVNYFTVLPEQGTCARVGLTMEQADQVRRVARRLADITRRVAQESGADLLDVAALSRAHNACASDPWLLGAHPDTGISIPPFHPTGEAMHAVGEALAKLF
jgi:lysophospholipase L1-like esterase